VRELLVAYAVRCLSVRSEPSFSVSLILLIVALKPDHLTVPLEGDDVCGDTVKEPPIVAYHYGAAREIEKRFL
jgi:hypothetical protein